MTIPFEDLSGEWLRANEDDLPRPPRSLAASARGEPLEQFIEKAREFLYGSMHTGTASRAREASIVRWIGTYQGEGVYRIEDYADPARRVERKLEELQRHMELQEIRFEAMESMCLQLAEKVETLQRSSLLPSRMRIHDSDGAPRPVARRHALTIDDGLLRKLDKLYVVKDEQALLQHLSIRPKLASKLITAAVQIQKRFDGARPTLNLDEDGHLVIAIPTKLPAVEAEERYSQFVDAWWLDAIAVDDALTLTLDFV